MINFYFADFAKVVLAFFLALIQSPVNTAEAHIAMLQPGDDINGVTLISGAADAKPLWAFCSSEIRNNLTTANCQVPLEQAGKLAIGHVFLPRDNVFSGIDWSDLEWELYLDDRLIDLADFGTYHYVLPTMAPSPSYVREVFMRFTAWDIVLTDLQPGAHVIEGKVGAGVEEYSWVVNLVIQDAPAYTAQSSEGKDSRQSQSRCSQNVKRLPHFQNSCRFYG